MAEVTFGGVFDPDGHVLRLGSDAVEGERLDGPGKSWVPQLAFSWRVAE